MSAESQQRIDAASRVINASPEMSMMGTLTPVPGGTNVTIRCENVPAGIRHEEDEAGLSSTLENLAAFTEGR